MVPVLRRFGLSVVVGVDTGSEIIFGADSALTGMDGSQSCDREPKIWKCGEFLFGAVGESAHIMLFQSQFDHMEVLDGFESAEAEREWLYTKFWPDLQTWWHRSFCPDSKPDDDAGFTLLVGCSAGLYTVDAPGDISQPMEDYVAVGSGRDLALGSLYGSTMSVGCTDTLNHGKVRTAVHAAIKFNAYVTRPVITKRLVYGE